MPPPGWPGRGLYPLPAPAAWLGWVMVFLISARDYILLGLATLAVGVGVYLWRARLSSRWPFVLIPSTHLTPEV